MEEIIYIEEICGVIWSLNVVKNLHSSVHIVRKEQNKKFTWRAILQLDMRTISQDSSDICSIVEINFVFFYSEFVLNLSVKFLWNFIEIV